MAMTRYEERDSDVMHVEAIHLAKVIRATSKGEAYEIAHRLCREVFPEREGWTRHSVSAVEVLPNVSNRLSNLERGEEHI